MKNELFFDKSNSCSPCVKLSNERLELIQGIKNLYPKDLNAFLGIKKNANRTFTQPRLS